MLKHIAQNLALIGLGTVVALLVGEILTRAIRPPSTVEYQIDPEIGQMLVPNQTTRFLSQTAVWMGREFDQTVTTNGAGFHDVEHTVEKPEGVYRIVVVGDSVIEGLQVAVEDGFTQQCERMLNEQIAARHVEVINLGISGSGPAQYYRRLEKKGLPYKPDLIVMAVLPDNDFWDSFYGLSAGDSKLFYAIRSDGRLDYIPPHVAEERSVLRRWSRQSALIILLREAIYFTSIERWLGDIGILKSPGVTSVYAKNAVIPPEWYVYAADPPEPWPDAYRVTLRMIQESKELADHAGAKFLVMLVGSVYTVEERWDEAFVQYPAGRILRWDYGRPFDAITDLGRKLGFEVINLVEPFRHDFLKSKASHSWRHDGHWNRRGHRLAAELVSAQILRNRIAYWLN